jgi:hypothetical protein
MADLKFAEPARFDGEEARFRSVKNKKYREGEVLVIRNERPQRGPGMREALAIRDAVALLFSRLFCVARMSEATSGIFARLQGRPAFRPSSLKLRRATPRQGRRSLGEGGSARAGYSHPETCYAVV